jgi:hypothetical protein
MGMDKQDMQDVFMLETKTKDEVLRYIQDVLKIEADSYKYIGKEVICVDPSQYIEVLKRCKEFILNNKIKDVNWLDYKGRAYPALSSIIAYASLPKHKIVGENKPGFTDRLLWSFDEYTPRYLMEYLEAMKEYLKVEQIIRDYIDYQNEMIISSLSIEHKEQMKLIGEFIKEYGYGPFDKIYPSSYIGKKVDEPFKEPQYMHFL